MSTNTSPLSPRSSQNWSVEFTVSNYYGGDRDRDDDDSKPLYGRGRRVLMRVIVLVCVGALVAPGIASAMSHYYVIAHTTCARAAHYSDPATQTTRATFEIFGPGGIGWECYATSASAERHVVSLGMFPVDVVPDGPVNRA